MKCSLIGKNCHNFDQTRKYFRKCFSLHQQEEWKSTYENCGLIKKGQTNIGSGTTPTIFDEGAKVTITDNASPQINVVIYDTTNGKKLSQTPVFPKMRSANEASLIGVEKHLVVENNFGHATGAFFTPQTVANEPGKISKSILVDFQTCRYDKT